MTDWTWFFFGVIATVTILAALAGVYEAGYNEGKRNRP